MSKEVPGILRYETTAAPMDSLEVLAMFVTQELRKLEITLNLLCDGQIEKTYRIPDKLRDGMIRFADGATWNPGSGRGIYFYDLSSTAWVKLG